MQQRYTGVSQGLRESGAVVEWSLEGKAESIKDAFYTLEQDKPVDILIAVSSTHLAFFPKKKTALWMVFSAPGP